MAVYNTGLKIENFQKPRPNQLNHFSEFHYNHSHLLIAFMLALYCFHLTSELTFE